MTAADALAQHRLFALQLLISDEDEARFKGDLAHCEATYDLWCDCRRAIDVEMCDYDNVIRLWYWTDIFKIEWSES